MYKYALIPLIIIRDLLKFVIVYLPGTTGVQLRRIYYKTQFKSCGKNLIIDIGVSIDGPEHISVGDNVFIDKYCVISTGKEVSGKVEQKLNDCYKFEKGDIVIGSDIHLAQFCILMGYGGLHIENKVVLSAGCKIYTLTNTAYDLNDKGTIVSLMPYKNANFLMSPVVLEQNVWLGLETIVMPGVVIGQNSFCVSSSVLVNKFSENSYISGNPSKRIRERFTKVTT